MKFKQLSILLVVLASVIIVAAPAFAADPCAGATVIANMEPSSIFDSVIGDDFNTVVVAYDLTVSDSIVAHVISNYKRVTITGTGLNGSWSAENVTTDDTFIDIVDNVTVFGRSVNRNQTGLVGVQGVITGAVNFVGSINTAIKGSYITSDVTGTNRMCFFLQ